jgi:hypothetical protein
MIEGRGSVSSGKRSATFRKPAIVTRLLADHPLGHHRDHGVCGCLRFPGRATSPAAHYDPYMFAIGVASLFGAACGAMGILISRIRQMKFELLDFERRLDEAADRNWEIREAQERTASFFEAQDDLIVRRDRTGAITYVNDAYCACRPAAGRAARHRLRTPGRGAGRDQSPHRWHALPGPENRRRRRRAMDRLA